MVHFADANKLISACWYGVWSKSSIYKTVALWNRNSKSIEGQQFINICCVLNIAFRTNNLYRIVQIDLSLCLFCHFLLDLFHTLKFESDFYSRRDTEHFLEQVPTIAFYSKINNDGRLLIFERKREY